jgi:hypothetical protein
MIGQSTPDPETVGTAAAIVVAQPVQVPAPAVVPVAEVGGRGGPEPTRYGDWEKNGRCIDFCSASNEGHAADG